MNNSARDSDKAKAQAPEAAEAEEESNPPSTGAAVGTRLSASEIHDNVRLSAEEELRRPAAALFWSALAAGLVISFSFLAAAYLRTLAPEHFKNAAAAAGYPLGFMFVVLARNQLFTENTLEPVIPLLHRPTVAVLRQVAVLWAVVLAGNLIGALVFAWLAVHTPMLEPELKSSMSEVAAQATTGGFGLVLWRAVFGGWLMALLAWLLASTRATIAQLALIWLATAPIAAFGFRHSVAGAVEAFYRAGMGQAGWPDMVWQFLVPAILGNIVGGVVFVALINHGQVAADRAASDD